MIEGKWNNVSDRASVLEAAKNATVIWDFDGVVADTEPLQAQSYRILLERRGYTPSEDFFLTLIGHTELEIWATLRSLGAPVAEVDALIEERRAVLLELATEGLKPSWLASDLMVSFRSVAKRQVILSNGDLRTIKTLLTAWNLAQFVEFPQQDSLGNKAYLLTKLLQTDDCVIFEDGSDYLQVARDAGSFCVGVLHSMSQSRSLPAHITVSI